jgi:hypothetical protein
MASYVGFITSSQLDEKARILDDCILPLGRGKEAEFPRSYLGTGLRDKIRTLYFFDAVSTFQPIRQYNALQILFAC